MTQPKKSKAKSLDNAGDTSSRKKIKDYSDAEKSEYRKRTVNSLNSRGPAVKDSKKGTYDVKGTRKSGTNYNSK